MKGVRLTFDRGLGVVLCDHTVLVGGREDGPPRYAAGQLVRRCGVELGYVWQVGNSWQWQTPTRANHGERSSLSAALKVLCDVADLGGRRSAREDQAVAERRPARLPFDNDPPPTAPPVNVRPAVDRSHLKTGGRTSPIPAMRRAVVESAPKATPPKQVNWDAVNMNTTGLTAAIAAQLERHKR